MPPPIAAARVLFVGEDSDVRADVLRLAAAAGTAADCVEAPDLNQTLWTGSDLVVIDGRCADQVETGVLGRRAGVLIATSDRPTLDLWSTAVTLGVEQVLEIPAARSALLDRLTDLCTGTGPLGALVVVVGGSGGAGASTTAVALALSAARSGSDPVLLGTDPWDGGIDVVLGAEDVPGPRWAELTGVSSRLSSPAILAGLPQAHGVRFLSSTRRQPVRVPQAALRAVVEAARRTGGPVIIDLPRQDEAASWLGPTADLALVVCPATVSGALASRSLVAGLAWSAGNCGIVIRRGFKPEIGSDPIARAIGLPVIAEIREDRRLPAQRRRGEAPGLRSRSALARSCDALWHAVADRRGG